MLLFLLLLRVVWVCPLRSSLLFFAGQGISLGGLPLQLALASSLVLRPLGVHLLLDSALTSLLGLGTVDLRKNMLI